MLLNYLLVALHGLRRQPVFSAVKVLSLTIGLGCSLLVLMHVGYTLSYDKHIPNWQNVYGVVTSIIIGLLTWDFLQPVLIACVIALVGGYFAILYYLRPFSSRTELPVAVYLAVTAGTLLVAVLTVSVQCWRAANADPVKSLRYE